MSSANNFRSFSNRSFVPSLLILFLTVSGCAVTDFVSKSYENSVAYFNTYYNASRLYDEAVEEIRTTEQNQLSRGLPPSTDISYTARQKLTVVIEKCSKILLYYPESKWVDDALLLIGKAYFYQGEYTKAERKFSELLNQFPNSGERLEAHLWLGKSLRRTNEMDLALRELRSLAEEALVQDEHKTAAEAFLSLGEVYTELNSSPQAIAAYSELINRTEYSELKAPAQFRIGELLEQAGDHKKAAEAYQKVLGLDPDFYLMYRANSKSAVAARNLGRYEESLRLLYGLLDDPPYVPYYAQIKLEIAATLSAKGDIESAILGYEILDSLYARTEAAAKGYYQLGLIYEKQLHNYAAAETNYVHSTREFPGGEVFPLASKRAENIRKYFLQKDLMFVYDDQLVKELRPSQHAAEHPRVERVDSVLLKESSPSPVATDSTMHVVRKDTLLDINEDERHVDRDRSDEKDDVATGEDDKTHTTETASIGVTKAAKKDTIRTLHFDLWDTPATSSQIRSLKLSLAQTSYDLATLFLLELEEPDSALFWCHKTYEVSPDSELAARALYTLAEVHRARGPAAKPIIDSLYRRIANDYAETVYASEARRILGLTQTVEGIDSAVVAYRAAEKLLNEHRAPEAIASLEQIADMYPQSDYAAKSLYTIGWIYENLEGNPDSARSSYRRLSKLFPRSKYAASVTSKLSEIDTYLSAQQAKEDSLKGTTGVVTGQHAISVDSSTVVIPDSSVKSIVPIDDETLIRAKTGVGRPKIQQGPKSDSTKVPID